MNANVEEIMNRLKARGFNVRLVDGAVKVAGPGKPDVETQSLLNELRSRKAEVRAMLSESDPVLSVDAWFPVFSVYVHQVIDQSKNFDLGWVRENRQELYCALKNKEAEIDALQEAQLSTVMALVQQWRDLILRGEFEQRKAEKESG